MSKIKRFQGNKASRADLTCGFSLIELMVAITLGILLSLGLVTLFGATSKTNRVQEAMAQLQESGRYAMSRVNADMRMVAHQTLNVSGFVSSTPSAATTPNGVVNPTVAADVYVATILLPDFDSAGLSAPAGWPAGTQWPLSQRYLLQGYDCWSGACTPALPTGAGALPAVGVAAGNRIGSADVLTMRYLNADGWSLSKGELTEVTSAADTVSCQGGALTSVKVTPVAGSAAFNFQAGDLALLIAGSRSEIFQVTVSGSTLTPTAVVGGTVPCYTQPTPGSGASIDATLYNFSRDFITVTYYLKLDADPNDAARFIPALVRRQSSISNVGAATNDQEIVQGVEQLDFLVGVVRADGTVSYLKSDAVAGQSNFANCQPVPSQYVSQMPAGSVEPECLWRAVKSIEAHMLIDSINNLYNLTSADMAYQYGYNYFGTDVKQTAAEPPAPAVALPSGLTAGNMLRREFVTLVSLRNFNP